MQLPRFIARHFATSPTIKIGVSRGPQSFAITPAEFETFEFQHGDRLSVNAPTLSQPLPVTWGDTCVPISEGRSIRVPAVYQLAEFKGFKIPQHLVSLTGAGPETLDAFGKAHIEKYQKYLGLSPEMVVVDLGCGIGRDAFQLLNFFKGPGRYIGVDVTRDSILWCQRNITSKHPEFQFHHSDAFNELYNPLGRKTTMEFRFPVRERSVDRIMLASVFTHLLEDEVVHYMREFRRVLKPDGLVYASFFLYSADALQAAETKGNTAWKATFEHQHGDGVYGNDPTYPRGAVAYTDAAVQRMISKAGLRLVRPYLKGWWSGLHGDGAEDGQDAMILAPVE